VDPDEDFLQGTKKGQPLNGADLFTGRYYHTAHALL